MWSDWDTIMAETIRAVLETNCHPQALEDAKRNLKIYDKQKKDLDKETEGVTASMKQLQGHVLNSIKNVLCWLGFNVMESCGVCGIEQPICWWADNDLYERITANRASIYCPKCFEELAHGQGIKLMWKPEQEKGII